MFQGKLSFLLPLKAFKSFFLSFKLRQFTNTYLRVGLLKLMLLSTLMKGSLVGRLESLVVKSLL